MIVVHAHTEPIIRPGDRKGLRAPDETPSGRARLACVILRKVERNIHHAQMTRAMLECVNDGEELKISFQETYEAHGLNVVYRAILDSLIIILSRMYDPVFPKKKLGLDRASLPHLMHLLEDPDTQNQFLAAAWHWTPGMIEEKQMRTCAERLESALDDYSALSASGLGKSVLSGLKWYRDANLAHSLFRGVRRKPLIYGEIGELLEVTSPIIENLSLAMMGKSWADDGSDEAKQRAEAFWAVVETGMKAKKGLFAC